MEPLVLPARVPLLLVNGASGIAVGIATKIPPHNLGEVVAGLRAMIADPDISSAELMRYIPGPDFPTGGTMLAGAGLADAYAAGRGGVTLRASVAVESPEEGSKRRRRSDRELLVITEIPYQTNKADLVQKIAELVDNRIIDGISGPPQPPKLPALSPPHSPPLRIGTIDTISRQATTGVPAGPIYTRHLLPAAQSPSIIATCTLPLPTLSRPMRIQDSPWLTSSFRSIMAPPHHPDGGAAGLSSCALLLYFVIARACLFRMPFQWLHRAYVYMYTDLYMYLQVHTYAYIYI